MPADLDETGLTLMFQNFGLVETSRIVRHGRTMVSKGYGFVKLSEPSQVSCILGVIDCLWGKVCLMGCACPVTSTQQLGSNLRRQPSSAAAIFMPPLARSG